MHYPTTSDERYFVVKGRLWRCSNPALRPEERSSLVKDLMTTRRAVRLALNNDDEVALKAARQQVNTAKVALGERGDVWWSDGAPDFNRKLVKIRLTPLGTPRSIHRLPFSLGLSCLPPIENAAL